ncbi:MAG: lipoate--protein ligase [Oscillospiraceae bacterium]
MIYIETGSSDAFFNFGLEYYFTAVKQLSEPVFLFWRTQPTLMVGKYQNTLEEIDQAYAEAHGIQVVRRMSGGGTIYTDPGGWQFTFIEYGDGGEIHFQEFISPVVEALRALGVPAEFNGRNDLLIEGKKFSGNAQYKLAGNTVHHGSLLFATDIEQMVRSTTVDDYKIVSKSIKSVRDRVTNISEHLPRPISAEEFKRHMISYIMRGSEKRYELTEEDKRECQRLADEYFRPWERRYGANPKCSLTKTGRFAGGKIEFRLDIRRGEIAAAHVSGDFFGTAQADGLADALIGCRFEREAVRQALLERGMDEAVYGITAENMVETMFS